jgi:histidinol phosphatase-like PHP family hydrolase
MNRGYMDSPYPSLHFLKLFRENNVPAMINADAHMHEDLDGYYQTARDLMLAAGYSDMVLFEGRSLWKKEKIQC